MSRLSMSTLQLLGTHFCQGMAFLIGGFGAPGDEKNEKNRLVGSKRPEALPCVTFTFRFHLPTLTVFPDHFCQCQRQKKTTDPSIKIWPYRLKCAWIFESSKSPVFFRKKRCESAAYHTNNNSSSNRVCWHTLAIASLMLPLITWWKNTTHQTRFGLSGLALWLLPVTTAATTPELKIVQPMKGIYTGHQNMGETW